MQKHVNLVDLVKSFPTNIYLQNLASIQKRTSSVNFAHLAEKSGKGSISNLSTKVCALLNADEALQPMVADVRTRREDAVVVLTSRGQAEDLAARGLRMCEGCGLFFSDVQKGLLRHQQQSANPRCAEAAIRRSATIPEAEEGPELPQGQAARLA